MEMLKKISAGIFLALFLCACFFAAGCAQNTHSSNVATVPDTALTVKMLDIGQGDAVLIRTGTETVLMDTGDVDERDRLVALLQKEGVKKIDKLIVSHPHADHLGGAYAVLNHFEVGQVYDNGRTANTSVYKTYMKLIKQKAIPYQQLEAGMKLDFGGAEFTVFSPEKGSKQDENLNDDSIVGQLRFGKFTMLFTGDAEAAVEKSLIQKYGDSLRSLVLKSPHHGSKTSSNRNYLKAVAPEAVLISVGAGNDYKHPHQVTLNKYKDLKCKVYRTDTDGAITVRSDGTTYEIAKEK